MAKVWSLKYICVYFASPPCAAFFTMFSSLFFCVSAINIKIESVKSGTNNNELMTLWRTRTTIRLVSIPTPNCSEQIDRIICLLRFLNSFEINNLSIGFDLASHVRRANRIHRKEVWQNSMETDKWSEIRRTAQKVILNKLQSWRFDDTEYTKRAKKLLATK